MPDEKLLLPKWTNLFTCSTKCGSAYYTSREDIYSVPTDRQNLPHASKKTKGLDNNAASENRDNNKCKGTRPSCNTEINNKNDKSAWKRLRQTLGLKPEKNCGQVTYIDARLLQKCEGFPKRNSKGKKGNVIIIPKIVITGPEDDGSLIADDGDTSSSGSSGSSGSSSGIQ